MADRVTFSKEEYKEKKIRIYITFPSGLFQSNFTGDDNFESDIDCLERARHNVDTGNIKIKKRVNVYKDYQEKVKKEKRIAEGRYKSSGYIYIKCPNHPFANANGCIREHRIVLEQWLRKHEPDHPALIEVDGTKYLDSKWIPHHKNGMREDNNIGNLLPVTAKQHRLLHTAKGLIAFLEKNPDVKISKEYHIF